MAGGGKPWSRHVAGGMWPQRALRVGQQPSSTLPWTEEGMTTVLTACRRGAPFPDLLSFTQRDPHLRHMAGPSGLHHTALAEVNSKLEEESSENDLGSIYQVKKHTHPHACAHTAVMGHLLHGRYNAQLLPYTVSLTALQAMLLPHLTGEETKAFRGEETHPRPKAFK